MNRRALFQSVLAVPLAGMMKPEEGITEAEFSGLLKTIYAASKEPASGIVWMTKGSEKRIAGYLKA